MEKKNMYRPKRENVEKLAALARRLKERGIYKEELPDDSTDTDTAS